MATLPVLASFSEAVFSVVRGYNPSRAASRSKGKPRRKGNKRAIAEQEAINKLVTRALFHADLVQSGLMTDLLSFPTSPAPEVLSTKQCQALLVTRRHLLTHTHKLEARNSPKLSPPFYQQHRTMTYMSSNQAPRTTLRNARASPKTNTSNIRAVLDLLVTQFEKNERQGVPLETWVTSAVREFKMEESERTALQRRADLEPRNARAQTHLLVALHCGGAEADKHIIRERVESQHYARNPVIIGIYQDALGLRARLHPQQKEEQSADEMKLTILRCLVLVIGGLFVFTLFRPRNSANKDKKSGLSGLRRSMLGDEDGYEVTTPSVTFEDVAGNNHAVQEMEELVSFLTEPETYTDMGCQIPKGYLLCGPPGVGKTLLAKALAGEAAVPFYYASGSSFEEVFVGVGSGRVRKLFEEAQANAPSIIFIDEIDSIGMKRSNTGPFASNRATLNQMLSAMDGFEDNNGVIVIAATNDPESLDPALMREGRFDSKISIRAPTVKGRLEILKVHTRNKLLERKVDLENLASACVGMTGAQLATLANNAAILCVLDNRDEITQDDFELARANMLIGLVNDDLVISDKELLNTAAHEAGHALVTLLREGITKGHLYVATVEPRGQTLGHVQPVPKVDQHTADVASLIAFIDICVAGRIGEELLSDFQKDKVTTGCSSDMKAATERAEYLISYMGYSPKIGLMKNGGENNDLTDKTIQEEMKKLLNERYEVVKLELLLHRHSWRRLTDLLVKYKTLTGGEVKAIVAGGSPDRLPGEKIPSN